MGITDNENVNAYCRIKVWNKKGEKVFTINENAKSKGTVAVVGGIPVMKPEKVLPLCEDSADQLMEDLRKRIQKITAKAAEKL